MDAIERLERMVKANERAIEIMCGSYLNRERPQEMAPSLAEVQADVAALREAIRALKARV